ncbi:hypothetical protein E5083_30305 [Streptomyces bauhiniae]|uniref:Lipoprotein n=1 Tax=Streptomyces bauhiniae TaxID=2340725 RepID=A0A4Z1CU73_9ACTN|nr:hypothetical protein [Streptomyces bauhiniae]TGN72231.1 hypothetical protein E5083_30305 [Streptomyces bauhiniae]
MRRRPVLLIPLVLLAATACVSVRAEGRPAPPPATTAAAVAPPVTTPPSQAPAREALVRTDDDRPHGRGRDFGSAAAVPKPPVRRTAPPRAAAPPPRMRPARPAPAAPRRTAAPVPRVVKKPLHAPPANHDMRALCRSAARNGVGSNIVELCRSTYG